MITATPHPNPTVNVTRHEKEGWQEEERYAIVREGEGWLVLVLWEAVVDGDVIPHFRKKHTAFRADEGWKCRAWCAANNVRPHLDYSV